MGPTTMVLLPQELNNEQLKDIKTILDTVSNEVVKSDIWDWEFWVNNTKSIGGNWVGEGRPFAIAARLPEMETQELEIIVAEFGFEPQQALQLDAMSNSQEDHRIMGVLLLHLAETLHGVVNFNGALLPSLPKEMYEGFWLWQEANWSDVATYFDEMVSGIPGKVVSVEYETIGDRTWAYHVGDNEFMKAWLQHPYFHMIK